MKRACIVYDSRHVITCLPIYNSFRNNNDDNNKVNDKIASLTVVMNASSVKLSLHSHTITGPRMLSTITSMESAI